MFVEFRCKASGNTIKFSNPNDIESMRKEAHYEEVKNEITSETPKENSGVVDCSDAKKQDENESKDGTQRQEKVLIAPKKRGRKPNK
jgi:hypothetical protein